MCGVCVVTYTLYFLAMLGQKMPQHTLARMFSLYTCNKSSCSNSLMIILTSKSLFCVVLSGPEVSSVFAAVLRSCMAVLVCGDNNMVSYFSSSCHTRHTRHTQLIAKRYTYFETASAIQIPDFNPHCKLPCTCQQTFTTCTMQNINTMHPKGPVAGCDGHCRFAYDSAPSALDFQNQSIHATHDTYNTQTHVYIHFLCLDELADQILHTCARCILL